jgi:hypothetical protein
LARSTKTRPVENPALNGSGGLLPDVWAEQDVFSRTPAGKTGMLNYCAKSR